MSFWRCGHISPVAVEEVEGGKIARCLVCGELGPVRDTLSRLQMVYAQQAGGASAPRPAEPAAAPEPEGPGPAQSSGRLWIPGQ